MNAPEIFDPLAGPAGGWPAGTEAECAYLKTFVHSGSLALIGNLRTRVLGLRSGKRIFPVTVNEAEYGDAYVCLPHSAYALYAKAELDIVDAGPWSPVLACLADIASGMMRAGRINQIVHLNNWMLSTNLHDGWLGEDLPDIRLTLVRAYPNHIIAVRSLNEWSDRELAERFRADGWKMLPSRQIYVTDDLQRDWAPRRDTRRDIALLAKTPYRIDTMETLLPGDSERIAELYAKLYLVRYSRLNPAFTPAYIEMTHRTKVIQYRGFRDVKGVLAIIVGCFVRGRILTTPIVGYDTTRPREEGLYRMASILLTQVAQERDLRLNSSAGAASFKRSRGARPLLEYSAFFVDHLSWSRRTMVVGMERLLNKLTIPLMRERSL